MNTTITIPRKKRGSSSYSVDIYPEETRRRIEEWQRVHLLSSMGQYSDQLLSEREAYERYGETRIRYLTAHRFITPRTDIASGRRKYLRGDIDTVIFANYHERLSSLIRYQQTGVLYSPPPKK